MPNPRIITAHDCSLMVVAADATAIVSGLAEAGLQALGVSDSQEAAAVLFDPRPEKAPLMVLLDADRMDAGLENLLLDLRRHPRLKYMTVILLRGPAADLGIEIQGAGVNLLMRKPADPAGYKELGERLRRLMPIAG